MSNDAIGDRESLTTGAGVDASAPSSRAELLASFQAATRVVLDAEAPTLTEDYLLGEGEIDSLDLIEIMMELEDTVGFTVESEDLDGVRTVGDAIDMILAKRAEVA